jgi:hypothetical protein
MAIDYVVFCAPSNFHPKLWKFMACTKKWCVNLPIIYVFFRTCHVWWYFDTNIFGCTTYNITRLHELIHIFLNTRKYDMQQGLDGITSCKIFTLGKALTCCGKSVGTWYTPFAKTMLVGVGILLKYGPTHLVYCNHFCNSRGSHCPFMYDKSCD